MGDPRVWHRWVGSVKVELSYAGFKLGTRFQVVMPTNEFRGKAGDKNLVAFAGMVTPEIVTDVFRANGGILLLQRLGVIEEDLVERFEACFEELRSTIIQAKGIVPVVTR